MTFTSFSSSYEEDHARPLATGMPPDASIDAHSGASCNPSCQPMKCDCDIQMLDFLLESFFCMFPEPDWCHCPCGSIHYHDEAPCAFCGPTVHGRGGCPSEATKQMHGEARHGKSLMDKDSNDEDNDDDDDGIFAYPAEMMDMACYCSQ